MRVTNSMITEHSKVNINGTKVLVDKYNTQMTDQKKLTNHQMTQLLRFDHYDFVIRCQKLISIMRRIFRMRKVGWM